MSDITDIIGILDIIGIQDICGIIFGFLPTSFVTILKHVNKQIRDIILDKFDDNFYFEAKHVYSNYECFVWAIDNCYINRIDIWELFKNFVWWNINSNFTIDKIRNSLKEGGFDEDAMDTFYLALNIIKIPEIKMFDGASGRLVMLFSSTYPSTKFLIKNKNENDDENNKLTHLHIHDFKNTDYFVKISKIIRFLFKCDNNSLILKFMEKGYLLGSYSYSLVDLIRKTYDHNILDCAIKSKTINYEDATIFFTIYNPEKSYGDYLRYVDYLMGNFRILNWQLNHIIECIFKYGELEDLSSIGLSIDPLVTYLSHDSGKKWEIPKQFNIKYIPGMDYGNYLRLANYLLSYCKLSCGIRYVVIGNISKYGNVEEDLLIKSYL